MMGRAVSNLLGMAGALAGGIVGVFVFGWIVGQGFYAPFLIGGLAGLGCMGLASHPSWGRGIACGLLALGLEVVAEWREFPFLADRRFGYFLSHLHQLRPLTMILMAVGAALAAWLGRDRLGLLGPLAPAPGERGANGG